MASGEGRRGWTQSRSRLRAAPVRRCRASCTGPTTRSAAAQPKSFVPLLNADHLASSRTAAATLADVLLSWFAQTLG